MSKRTRFIAPLVLLAGVLSAWSISGCSSAVERFCNDKCDCEGCGDDARQSCITINGNNDQAARDAGCADEQEAWASCLNDPERSQCIQNVYRTDGCNESFAALSHCLTNANCLFVGTDLQCAK